RAAATRALPPLLRRSRLRLDRRSAGRHERNSRRNPQRGSCLAAAPAAGGPPMNEFDVRIFDLLDVFTPEPHRWPDWQDVLRRTRTRHTRRIVVAVAAAVAVLGCAAGVTAALRGFHAWLSGSPGKPAPTAEQKRFEQA